MADDPRFETRAIHIGQGADKATGATIVPIYQTATFTQDTIGNLLSLGAQSQSYDQNVVFGSVSFSFGGGRTNP